VGLLSRRAVRAPAILAAALSAALALSCAAHPPAAAPPAAATSPHAARAVLVSFDGVSADLLTELLGQPGKLPFGGYRTIAARGLAARRSRPPTPSLTAPAHVTHVTGAMPEATGIVANWMLDRSKPFGAKLSGFDAPIRADTLWQAARRQGKRVGVLLYPGGDGTAPERTADFGLTFHPKKSAPARFVRLASGDWTDGGASTVRSYSPPRTARLEFPPTHHAATLVAIDTTDDGRVNYDRVEIMPESGETEAAGPGDWFGAEAAGEARRTGAWCKLLALAPDLSGAEIYAGGLFSSDAYPEAFRRDLDENAGFWPGVPDQDNADAHSPHPEIYVEQADRLAAFLTRAQVWAIRRGGWDLLLFYQPQVDEVEHPFFLTDPRQAGYTPERAVVFRGYVERAYATADRALDAIAKALSPSDALLVTSDHGMTPVRKTIYPNEILRQAGLTRMSGEETIDPSSAAAAIAESGIANVYLNPAEAPPDALARIEKLFAEYRVAGEAPFDRIVRRADAGPLGLDGPESGDLIVVARPGFNFSMSAVAGRTSGTPVNYGSHGYRNVYAPLDATFFAAGPGIAPARVDEFPSWRIASFLSRVLGIEPPRGAAP
jgi:predicted AlkP superfamily pyrophosphatase or phosphodiesterase